MRISDFVEICFETFLVPINIYGVALEMCVVTHV